MLGLTAFISLVLFDMVSFFTAYTAPLSKFHSVHLTVHVCIAYLPSLVAIITDIRAVGSFQSHKEAVAFHIVLK